jgi:hypothetical protein
MRPSCSLLVALLLLGGCRSSNSDTGRNQPGVAADSELTGGGAGLGAAESGVEFEAPRLIPGMRAMLGVVADSGRLDEGTATGYKQAAGRLVDAMLTDLNRVGVGDDGSFRAMGDSVVDLLGGGTGVPDADAGEIERSAALLRRMIDSYQERMRSART